MTTPTIHANGTAKQDLMDALLKAHESLTASLKLLAETSPNRRDYYTQGEAAWADAVDAHHTRRTKLTEVKTELMELAMRIDEVTA